jgi:hypothetical protein
MVAGTFYHHGLETPKPFIYAPYCTYESKHFKVIQEGRHPGLYDFGKFALGGINQWAAVEDLTKPEHRHVWIRRDHEELAKALLKRKIVKDIREGQKQVEFGYGWMDTAQRWLGGPDVIADELWWGDDESLERAFEYCGVEFRQEIADSVIERRGVDEGSVRQTGA